MEVIELELFEIYFSISRSPIYLNLAVNAVFYQRSQASAFLKMSSKSHG